MVNTFRYGFTRIDSDTLGLRDRDINETSASSTTWRSTADVTDGRDIKTHNFVDDLSW